MCAYFTEAKEPTRFGDVSQCAKRCHCGPRQLYVPLYTLVLFAFRHTALIYSKHFFLHAHVHLLLALTLCMFTSNWSQ